MNLIVINPVVEKLIGQNISQLLTLLRGMGYATKPATGGAWVVINKYRLYLKQRGENMVIDSRCPKIIDMVTNEFPTLIPMLAPINPILITGAKLAVMRLQAKYPLEQITTTVITPCQALVDDPRLPDGFRAITWKQFKSQLSTSFTETPLDSSPVPLGFFNDLSVKVVSASGEEQCRDLLQNIPTGTRLLELLWCPGGCHNGDGL